MRFELLGNLTTITTGKLDVNAGAMDGKYPFFTCAAEPYKINEYAFDMEAILVAGNGDLNVKYYKGKFNAYQRTYVIQINNNKEIDFKYLYYFMLGYVTTLRKQAIGGIIKYIKMNNLTDAKIPLPSLDEQIRIADVLSRTEALITKRKETIKMLDDYLKSVFLDMFWGGDGEKKYLGEVIEIQSGQVDPGVTPYSEMYHVGGANIEAGTGRLIALKKAEEENLISGKYLFNEGSVLYSKIRPYLNKVVIPKFVGICSADIYPINPKKEHINKYFLRYALMTNDFLEYAKNNSDRSSIPKINRNDLLKYSLTIPDIKKQNQFSRIVETAEVLRSKFNQSSLNLDILFSCINQNSFISV